LPDTSRANLRTLVVHCHPDLQSYSAALFHAACASLRQAGHELRTIELYAEKFDPVLDLDERRAYLDDTAFVEHRVQRHVDAMRWAEHLVFVHPTWWYGPPAMLKGWLERVWLPGVAFLPPPAKGRMAAPALRNIRRLTVVTTGGAPWWWLKVIGDPHRKLFTRGLRALMATRCRTTWLQLHDMNNASDRERAAFLGKVMRTLQRIR
jgi:NAD(P)H dehydrogenase (quinone)